MKNLDTCGLLLTWFLLALLLFFPVIETRLLVVHTSRALLVPGLLHLLLFTHLTVLLGLLFTAIKYICA